MESFLELEHISKNFGGVRAVEDVSFRVKEGEIKAIIGPNGAGKTTLFHLISGYLEPDRGKKTFLGHSIDGLKAHDITSRGIVRTFQNLSIFYNMSVLHNVMVGRHTRSKGEFFQCGLGVGAIRRQEQDMEEKSMQILTDVGLHTKAVDIASNLAYGELKLLEVARALASEPKLLLLDEPAAGLNEKETDEMADLILSIQKRGITVLLVEHDMSLVMNISHDILVLNYGVKLAEGDPESIQCNRDVIEAYLGEEIDV